VWKYLLDYIPYSCTQIEAVELRNKKIQEYHTLCQQWRSMTLEQEDRFSQFKDRKSLISMHSVTVFVPAIFLTVKCVLVKDVNRTDRNCEYFAGEDNPHLDTLNNILMSYMMYNFDLGYVQGMSDLLSPILMLMNNEPDAFWCFAGFMDKVV
jgi:TBC1 domain family member 15